MNMSEQKFVVKHLVFSRNRILARISNWLHFGDWGDRTQIMNEYRAEEGRILARWGDTGWGAIVEKDKKNGKFRDDLVDAVADMIRRWNPVPRPKWLTCVPSNRNVELVPNFSMRLAKKLGLQFLPIIDKIKDNEQQKLQQNNAHQCRNLVGVFDITSQPLAEPVILVDDIVDSKWTLTICSGLLRRSGRGPVFPIALATTAGG